MPKEYYDILGVSQSASTDEIKKAYRKIAMKYHPDRNQGDKKAEEKFKEAAEAYEVLGNLEKRKIYDHYGIEGLKSSGYSGGPGNFNDIFSNFGDIFEDLFGFGGGSRRSANGPVHGADLRYDLSITFMEAVHGTEKEIEISKPDTCWTCEGSGIRPGHQPETCSTCQGRGQIMRSQGFFSVSSTCPSCGGRGQIIKEPCTDCDGKGLLEKKKKVSLKIPAGVDNGARMRLTGEGEGGRRGGPAGDLYVFLYIENHELFQRDGQDIYLELPLSMTQAALGCTPEIPTIHGDSTLEIPPGTQSGQRFTIRSEGVPSLRGKGRGNMIVVVTVKIPGNLTDRQKEILAEFAKLEEEKESEADTGFFKKIFKMTG
ncbi:MAG: molecular chaperone DnaJ [Proteobacteria bacterium]|nr:molecular chaperone DnaJ [Pseudomonadota bacterium]MBU1737743.1 molecular chaperone DnaJ [Pseudomonadota bacterium]